MSEKREKKRDYDRVYRAKLKDVKQRSSVGESIENVGAHDMEKGELRDSAKYATRGRARCRHRVRLVFKSVGGRETYRRLVERYVV
jgi:hypothetical protein